MSLTSIHLDDFDPPLIYTDPTQWNTPNPQDNPTWFNESAAVSGSEWFQGTYHETIVVGASVSFNFTGSSLSIIGASSPTYSNYSILIDPSLSRPYTYSGSAYALGNGTARFVMYNTTDLFWGKHEVKVTNLGGGMRVDEVVIGTVVGGAGATLTNITLDEPSSEITYGGNWTTNTDPNFYGGSSIYTNTPNDNFTFSFSGSALYIFGDQVNDHGLYSIYYNGSTTPVATLSGRSGCGGTTGKFCEKLGGVHWVDSGLPGGRHEVRVVNGGGGTYFDLDRIVYTTPSIPISQALVTNSTCPFKDCSTATSGTPTGAATAAATTKASGAGRRVRWGLGVVLGAVGVLGVGVGGMVV